LPESRRFEREKLGGERPKGCSSGGVIPFAPNPGDSNCDRNRHGDCDRNRHGDPDCDFHARSVLQQHLNLGLDGR
jgi:hypothetical protein